MASNLRVEHLGSSSAVVSWDSESNGTVYTLHLQDNNENTLTSFETEETSVTFEDLTQGTNYVFKLYAVQSEASTAETYTKIRIDHPTNYWLNIMEVEVYALANDALMASTNFNMTSSLTYSPGVVTQAMNGTISTSWHDGAMLDYRSTSLRNFWEASFNPTQLSRLRLYTHITYKLNTGSTLTMTKENGAEVVYDLMDTAHWIDSVRMTQEISFADATYTAAADADADAAAPLYTGIQIDHIFYSWLCIVEVEAYGLDGSYLSPSNFHISSSKTYSSSVASSAMNGTNDSTVWADGAMMDHREDPVYWRASLLQPQQISKVRVYATASWPIRSDTTLTMTQQDGAEVKYSLEPSLTYQEIVLVDTPATSESTSASTSNTYKSVRLKGVDEKYITLSELEVYDGNGTYVSSTNFTFQSSGHYLTYQPSQAMNGNKTLHYKNGATISPDTPTYWQANHSGTEISKIVIYYYNTSTYLTYLSQSQLILTDVNNNETSYDLAKSNTQTITIDS